VEATTADQGPPEFLSSCELFSGLREDELETIQAIAKSRRFSASKQIFELGEPARSLFVIESGTVALTLPLKIREVTRAVTIEQAETGGVIAWSALVPPHKLTLSAVAVTDVCLLGLERADLAQIFERQPRIHGVVANNLCAVIADRLTTLKALLVRDLQRWVAEKHS
jgi:signal-transduction protein with cAMP-binding, CBS, and nucleotidyltransferase domain